MIGSQQLVHSAACFWPAALIVWGPGLAPGRHAHSCIQLSLAITGTLRIREHMRSPWRRCRALVVKANAEHETDATGSFVLHGFIAVESPLGAAVTTHRHSDTAIVSKLEAAQWLRTLADPKTLDSGRVERWISTLMRDGVPSPTDPRVDRVIAMLQRHTLDTHSTSLAQLSRVAGLSPSRFAHLFTESTGIPLRPYLRWLRLQRAARELMSGSTVTQAAHVASFADAAHLTRTFRRMLGIAPSALIQRRVQDHIRNARLDDMSEPHL